MSATRIGLRIPPCAPITEVAAFAERAERCGVHTVWIPDSQFLWRDAWAAATLVCDRTESVEIGVAVTNFQTRHPAVTASLIASLDELSGGRIKVAFGTGDSAVKTLGNSPTTLDRMRGNFDVVRRLLRGDEVVWATEGKYANRPTRLRHATGRDVPLYMSATGPRALALAGEIADGVLVAAGVAPALIQRALGLVADGATRAGRELAEIDIWLAAHTVICPDEAEAVQLVKPLCLAMAQAGASGALQAVGIDIDVPPVIEGIYPDVTHAETWDLAVRVAEQYIDDETAARFAQNLTLAGTPEQVTNRLATATELGVNAFFLLGHSSYSLPTTLLDGLTMIGISTR